MWVKPSDRMPLRVYQHTSIDVPVAINVDGNIEYRLVVYSYAELQWHDVDYVYDTRDILYWFDLPPLPE